MHKIWQITLFQSSNAKFALSKLAKTIWNFKIKCFITKSHRAELDLLIQIITDNIIKWSSPIAYLIPRTPGFQVWGDSSLDAAGGFSIDLGFYWHYTWPDSIRTKSVRFFKRKAKFDGEIISINLLEYMVIIINYATSSFLFKSHNLGAQYPHQTVLIWSDNRSAIAWTKQAAISSPGGKALSHIFCSLCINNDYNVLPIVLTQNKTLLLMIFHV